LNVHEGQAMSLLYLDCDYVQHMVNKSLSDILSLMLTEFIILDLPKDYIHNSEVDYIVVKGF